MQQIDLFCLVIVTLFTLYGFFKGFFTQLMSFVAILAAYFGAAWFAPDIGHFIAGFVKLPDMIATRLALIFSGLGIFLAIKILSALIHKHMINALTLTKYSNRLLGSVFGAAKGLCIVYILYILISWHPDSKSIYAKTTVMSWLHQSFLHTEIQKPEISKSKKDSLKKKASELQKKIKKKGIEHAQSELANQSLDKLIENIEK